jgi:hypothetical protein
VLLTCILATGPLGAQRRNPARDVTIPGTDLVVQPGWLLLQRDGCWFTVPLGWKAAASGNAFDGPDGSTLLVRRLQFSDWTAHIARTTRTLGSRSTVRDDTTQHLWIETRQADVVEEYAEARLDDGSCSLVLRYSTSGILSRDAARQIVRSLAPVRLR